MKTRSLLLYGALMLALAFGVSLLAPSADASRARQASGGAVSAAAARDTITVYARPGNYFAAVQLAVSALDTIATEPCGLKVWTSMNGVAFDSVATLDDVVSSTGAGPATSTKHVYVSIPWAPIVRFTCPNTGVWVCNADSLVMYPLLLEVEND